MRILRYVQLFSYATLFVLFVSAAVLFVGLWGGSGGVIELIAGQFPPSIRIHDRAVSLQGSGDSYAVTVRVESDRVINELPDEFVSFSIDSSQVVGSEWWNPAAVNIESGSGSHSRKKFDFDRPQLDYLVAELAPAYLRIGGSEADRLWYQMESSAPDPANSGFRAVLDSPTWDAVGSFAVRAGLKIIFTLNAGPGPRSKGEWDGANAESFIRYTTAKKIPVAVWEFGNELNGFWFVHGSGSQQSPENYALDFRKAASLVRSIDPTARTAPQSSAFWPIAGEAFSPFFGFMPRSLVGIGHEIDILSWHYYPQQSRRAPFATRRADPARMLDPQALDEAMFWARKMRTWRDAFAPGKPIWLGETGNAQFGGEPGVSDVYIGGLWWLDQLGLMAREGMGIVVRQTLSGSNYGLIDEQTLQPRPDYWNSWLWKRFMGSRVYQTQVEFGGEQGKNGNLRVYAHGTKPVAGVAHTAGSLNTTTLLLINLDTARNARVSIPQSESQNTQLWLVTTPDVLGTDVLVNGIRMSLDDFGKVPTLIPQSVVGSLVLPPLSYAFVQYSEPSR